MTSCVEVNLLLTETLDCPLRVLAIVVLLFIIYVLCLAEFWKLHNYVIIEDTPPSINCQLIICLLRITLCYCLFTFFFFFFFSEQKNILQTIEQLIQFRCLSTSTPAHLFPIRGRPKILGTRLIICCYENKVSLPIIFLKKSEQRGILQRLLEKCSPLFIFTS